MSAEPTGGVARGEAHPDMHRAATIGTAPAEEVEGFSLRRALRGARPAATSPRSGC